MRGGVVWVIIVDRGESVTCTEGEPSANSLPAGMNGADRMTELCKLASEANSVDLLLDLFCL